MSKETRESEMAALEQKIGALRAQLEPLEERRGKLRRQAYNEQLDGLIGRCFQDNVYDNDSDRTFLKVVERVPNCGGDLARVVTLELPTLADLREGSEPFYSIKISHLECSEISYEKEINSAAFDKHLAAIISFLEGCKSKKKEGKTR